MNKYKVPICDKCSKKLEYIPNMRGWYCVNRNCGECIYAGLIYARRCKMKKPKPPKNKAFWLLVAKNPKEAKLFEEKGNKRQKRELKKAQKYLKWRKVQKKEEE